MNCFSHIVDEGREQRDEVYNGEHQSHFTHELVGGGAAFEAMKLFEDSQRKKGQFVPYLSLLP